MPEPQVGGDVMGNAPMPEPPMPDPQMNDMGQGDVPGLDTAPPDDMGNPDPDIDNQGEEMENGDSVFDTGFDAGVDADEDEDPKKFTQQLTGKLSQTVRSYLQETDDEELAKYVAKMIVKQTAEYLSPKAKKDIIKTIKTADASSDVEGDNPPMEDEGEEPLNESYLSKKDILSIAKQIRESLDDFAGSPKKNKMTKKTVFSGKTFKA